MDKHSIRLGLVGVGLALPSAMAEEFWNLSGVKRQYAFHPPRLYQVTSKI
jgi:hypothetical protein